MVERAILHGVLASMIAFAICMGCGKTSNSRGGETNWLDICHSNADCRVPATCLCGVCTNECTNDTTCAGIATTTCFENGTAAFERICGSGTTISGACLPSAIRSADDRDAGVDSGTRPPTDGSVVGPTKDGGNSIGSPTNGRGAGRVTDGGEPAVTQGAGMGTIVDAPNTGRFSDASAGADAKTGTSGVGEGGKGGSTSFDAGSVSIVEYAVPAGAFPEAIAQGPDGNVWYACRGMVGRMRPDGSHDEFTVPGGELQGITEGPDGRMWFGGISQTGGQVGSVTVAGAVTSYTVPNDGSSAFTLAFDAAGNLWFPGYNASYYLARRTPDGTIERVFDSPNQNPPFFGLVSGKDGNVWFGDPLGGISRITQAGVVTRFPEPSNTAPLEVGEMVVGPDDDFWFVGLASGGQSNQFFLFGKMDQSGKYTLLPVDRSSYNAKHFAYGPDGAFWVTHEGELLRITTGGALQVVLPRTDSSMDFAGITRGAGRTLWATEGDKDRIMRITLN